MVLRLVFHDAATYDAAASDGGANASVRLELERPENKGLKRGWRVVEAAMAGEVITCRAGRIRVYAQRQGCPQLIGARLGIAQLSQTRAVLGARDFRHINWDRLHGRKGSRQE